MDAAPTILTWQAFPARREVGRAVGGGVVILALAGCISFFFWRDGFPPAFSIVLGLCGGAVLVFVLQRFYFPSTYTIDDQGITAQYFLSSKAFRWTELRRFVHDDRGGFLSTRAVPSRLDQWKGMHLVFGEHAHEAIAAIKSRMKQVQEPRP